MSAVITEMEPTEVVKVIQGLRQASKPGKTEDGARVHVWYKSFGTPSKQAMQDAQRAEDLGLPRDRYTGRVSRVWKSGAGDLLLTLLVELERDKKYRTLNVEKGSVKNIVVLES